MAVGTGGHGGGLPLFAVAAALLIAATVIWRFGGIYLTSNLVIDRWKHPTVFWVVIALLAVAGVGSAVLGVWFPHP